MSKAIKIRRGLNIRLKGQAVLEYKEATLPEIFAIKPPDFLGLTPKLVVKAGADVKAGTPLFHDKYNARVQFVSPVSGTVAEIVRGAKRRILEVRIQADGANRYEEFESNDPNLMKRDEIADLMLKSGVWPSIRQRPFACVAKPGDSPKAIYVSCTDTNPLAPNNDFIIAGQGEAFQTGLNALSKLTDGEVNLTMVKDSVRKASEFTDAQGVSISGFDGPHPAGNVGVQAHHIDPINKGDVIWYLYPQEVVTIGKLFMTGKYDASRIVALTGSEVNETGYYKTTIGAPIKGMVDGNVAHDNVRYVSGNPLTGKQIEADGFIGYYNDSVTVLPEGNQFKFQLTEGWMGGLVPLPPFGLNKFSASATYPFHKLMDDEKEWVQDTNLYGEERGFVVTGEYEKVFPFDIYPVQLVKACITNDIDGMEKLGIYEVDAEDFSLCEFVCTSKIDTMSIVRAGLELVKEECT
jgi:Na+-transporting NADH:ubiquinone oxidoreductase subunit A